MQDESLAKLDAVRTAIEQAATVQELKSVLDVAKAYQVYAQQQKLGEEIKQQILDYIHTAKVKLGEMLIAAKAAGQFHAGGDRQTIVGRNDNASTLAKAGISRDLSSEAQRLAKGQKATRAPKEHQAAPFVNDLASKGLTNPQIAQKTGLSKRQVRHIVEEEAIRRQERELIAEVEITPEMLKMSDRQKVAKAIQQQTDKVRLEYQIKLEERVRSYLDIKSKEIQEQLDRSEKIIKARTGFMSKALYKKIWTCLHPDRAMHPKRFDDPHLKDLYNEAFREFNKLEKFLLTEKDSPTSCVPPLPKTMAEWEAAKRKATADRKAKRDQKSKGQPLAPSA